MSRRSLSVSDLETAHAAIVRHARDGLAEQGDLDATGLAVHLAAEFERLIRASLAAKVRALPDHSVTGYEWDCAAGEPYTDDGTYRDDTGQVCPHYDDEGAISRAAVLALIEDPA